LSHPIRASPPQASPPLDVPSALPFLRPACFPNPPEVIARQFLFPLRCKLTAQHFIVETTSGVSRVNACASVPVYGIAKVPASPFKRTIGSP
jgi:hypothetical protein